MTAIEVVHGGDSNAMQIDPVISMDDLCSSVNKYTDILNDISADKSAIANECNSLDAIEVQEHSVRAVDGPDTKVMSVLVPLCASEDQIDIRKFVGNVISDKSVCISSEVVVSGVEVVVKDISAYVPVSENRVFVHDGHLSLEIVGSSTLMSNVFDSSCDLKFPQNLILAESLGVDASANVVNVDVPLLGIVVEEHHMLTDKKCLERENNLVLFKAKLDGNSFFQCVRKIFSATHNYLCQVLDVFHLSLRNAYNFWFWSHASELADDVISTAVYSNSSYKGFVVIIEPEPPPFILNIHVVPDYTAQTNIMKLLRTTRFRDYTVEYVEVREALLKAGALFYSDYDLTWIHRYDCSEIRAGALKLSQLNG